MTPYRSAATKLPDSPHHPRRVDRRYVWLPGILTGIFLILLTGETYDLRHHFDTHLGLLTSLLVTAIAGIIASAIHSIHSWECESQARKDALRQEEYQRSLDRHLQKEREAEERYEQERGSRGKTKMSVVDITSSSIR